MLYYNFHQCTGSSRQEFVDLTLGEVQDIIITYVNVNSKKKNKKDIKENDFIEFFAQRIDCMVY